MQPEAPLPVSAADVGGACEILFDRPLQPAPLDPGNWSVRHNNTRWFMEEAGALGSTATAVYLEPGTPEVGPDVVDYSPPPFDVLSVPGLPAAAFTDFPIT